MFSNNTLVGGCRQFGTTSKTESFSVLFIVTLKDFQLHLEETNQYVMRNDQGNINPGKYIVSSLSMAYFFSMSDHLVAELVEYLSVTLTK